MRKFFIGILFVTLACALVPRPTFALANLPQIIPDCDQTRYIIQQKVSSTFIGPPQGDVVVTPEEFGEDKQYKPSEWNLTGYTTNGNCTLNDFLQLFVNLFSWGMYIISVLALLFIFIGGGTLLMSGGSEERVRAGKAILTNTIIGVAIALGSWLIINTLYVAILPEGSTKNGIAYILDNQPWFRTSASKGYAGCNEPPEYPCKGGAGASIVRTVQNRMYTLGCYSNPGPRSEEVDGSFGPKTLAAWKRWQQVNNVAPTEIMSGYDNLTASCEATSFDESA